MEVSGKGCSIVGKKIKSEYKKNARNRDKLLLFNVLMHLLLPRKMPQKESIMQKKRYEDKSYLCEAKLTK